MNSLIPALNIDLRLLKPSKSPDNNEGSSRLSYLHDIIPSDFLNDLPTIHFKCHDNKTVEIPTIFLSSSKLVKRQLTSGNRTLSNSIQNYSSVIRLYAKILVKSYQKDSSSDLSDDIISNFSYC